MAEVQQKEGGKKKKGAQKKMTIRVDFTPMVDMNMLLITFFMLCTTMIKSQTLQITLPTNEKVNKEQQNQAKSSEAITLILDTEYNENGTPKHDPETGKTVHKVYWYSGVPDTINCNLECKEFLGDTRENGQKIHHGIREVLRDRNKEVMANYDILKQKWKDKEITKEEFEAEAKKNAADSTLTRPVVIIKPGPNTTYEALINALDEMKINQISRYNIQLPTAVDTTLIKMYGAKNGIPDIIKKNIRDNSIF